MRTVGSKFRCRLECAGVLCGPIVNGFLQFSTARVSRIYSPIIRILCATVIMLTVFGAQGGVIFTTLCSFGSIQATNGNPLDGAYPSGLVQGSEGSFYGTTSKGGTNGTGTLFRINNDGTGYKILYCFNTNCGFPPYFNSDGCNPGNLVLSSNTLYGTASTGGMSGNGTIFEVNNDGSGLQ